MLDWRLLRRQLFELGNEDTTGLIRHVRGRQRRCHDECKEEGNHHDRELVTFNA